jgi:hypothetical protein
MDIEIEIGPGGKVSLDTPQQQWHDEADVVQFARFAGQEMMVTRVSDDEPNVFELHYLGLVASGFESVDQAKAAASAFAKEVFHYLNNMIRD